MTVQNRLVILLVVVILVTLNVGCRKSGQNANATASADNVIKTNKNMVIELTSEKFSQLIGDYTGSEFSFAGKRPTIVDFYATWCGPCKALSPIMEEVASEYGDRVDFYRIDIDKAEDVAHAFGIQSVPTLIFFPVDGQPRTAVGLLPKETIKEAMALVFDVK